MKSVFVVTSGSYSDYRIEAVFSSRLLADGFASCFADCQVTEWELDAEQYKIRPDGKILFSVNMGRDGDGQARKCSTDETESPLEYIESGMIGSTHYAAEIFGTLYARDEQHAIKIANEKRGQLIAEDKWPVDLNV